MLKYFWEKYPLWFTLDASLKPPIQRPGVSVEVWGLTDVRLAKSQQTREVSPMLVYCWASVADVDQQYTNIGLMSRICWDPADTRCWINFGLTLVQRRRRWTNVKPTLIQHYWLLGGLICACWGEGGRGLRCWSTNPQMARGVGSARGHHLHVRTLNQRFVTSVVHMTVGIVSFHIVY